MYKITLKHTRESRVRSGHPWVFSSDIENAEAGVQPGNVVEVHSDKGTFLGKAFYNPNSMITLRMLTYKDEPVNEAFFCRRIERAWAYRRQHCSP